MATSAAIIIGGIGTNPSSAAPGNHGITKAVGTSTSVDTRSTRPGRLRSWSGLVETDFQGRLRFSYANRPVKVYMELGSYFLFLQEQIKDIIITQPFICTNGH